MQNDKIYTFRFEYSQHKTHSMNPELKEAHKMLKNPSFSELNKLINEYPASPIESSVSQLFSKISSKPAQKPSVSREKTRNIQETPPKEWTFKPKISYTDFQKTNKIPFQQKLEILAKPKTETIEKRVQLKMNQEIAHAAHFSYSPEITKYDIKHRIPLEKRIDMDKYKFIEREKLKRELEDKKYSSLTFQPKILNRKASLDRPIYERVDKIQVEKFKNIKKIKEKYEDGLSFKPKIDGNSRKICLRKCLSADTSDIENCDADS